MSYIIYVFPFAICWAMLGNNIVEAFPAVSVIVLPVHFLGSCHRSSRSSSILRVSASNDNAPDEEYRNTATKVLSNFMSSPKEEIGQELFQNIDWDATKIPKVSIEKLAQALDAELYEKEWFVTGNVNPKYFSNDFRFRDPDVQVSGIKKYAEGVRKIFNQETSRAEIISTIVSLEKPNTITCTWRLSGKVNIGPGLTIKPYIVYTDFTVDDETGLVIFQEDRFSLPGWDIIASALFPFLIGKLTSEPAPVPEPRNPPPRIPAELLDGILDQIKNPFDFFRGLISQGTK